ncbi:hypothetical protein VB780_09755 [Leptolyngbya sp. CCNP1308]|nr:hypothetical protein [Leptolyngbya sp. CCNP1308]MEA5448852.1 hypothetical protein [Leptolyngbya sp. CCNP1308]
MVSLAMLADDPAFVTVSLQPGERIVANGVMMVETDALADL